MNALARPRSGRLARVGRLASILGFGPVAASCAVQDPPPESSPGDVLALPTYTVTETAALPSPEHWSYAALPDLEVLSNASDPATSRVLRDFRDFQQVLAKLWSAPVTPPRHLAVILCRRQNKFSDFAKPGYNQGSLLLSDRERSAIVVDLEAVTTAAIPGELPPGPADDPATEPSGSGVMLDHASLLAREYVRLLLSQNGRRAPAWLEEGISQLLVETEYSDDWIVFGRVRTDRNLAPQGGEHFAGEARPGELSFNRYFIGNHRKLMPLGEMFAVPHDSDTARQAMGNQRWTKQALAFVHLCLCGQDLRYRPALLTFVGRLDREPLSEALFKECFKLGYAEMLEVLRGYLLHTRHKFERIKLAPGERLVASPVDLREATQGEIGRIKGDAQMLAGRKADALLSYRRAYVRGGREPDLLAALGVAEAAAGNPERAASLLNAASRSGADRPSAYLALAHLRLGEAKAAVPSATGKLDDGQVARVLAPLFQARQHPPALPETYELIAEAWSLSATPPTRANLEVLDEGIRSFPRNSDLALAAIAQYSRIGAHDTAASIAKLGLRFTSDPAARSRFEELLKGLSPN